MKQFERIRRAIENIRLLRQMRLCEKETGHAQRPNSPFCRCCYRRYETDNPLAKMAELICETRERFAK